jgi:hypothetical protein
MAEDCIRWSQSEPGVTTSRGGFRIERGGFTTGRPTWSLSWRKHFLRRFDSKKAAIHCAEDILRMNYGLTREDIEKRHDVDLSPLFREPPQ